MTPITLDAEATKVDLAMRRFTGVTAFRIGALADRNPDKAPELRAASEQVKAALIAWRKAYRDAAAKGQAPESLLKSGTVLRGELAALDLASKRATPGAFMSAVTGAGRVAAGVALDVGRGVVAVGQASIAAGKQALKIVNWLPWLMVIGAALYVLAPRLLASGIKGYAEGKRGEGKPA